MTKSDLEALIDSIEESTAKKEYWPIQEDKEKIDVSNHLRSIVNLSEVLENINLLNK